MQQYSGKPVSYRCDKQAEPDTHPNNCPTEPQKVVKGYFTPSGYMGFVGSKYMLFSSESDYLDYIDWVE